MIDLTPLDVRKKSEDFKRILRGFDPQEVQVFLELTAERMEELVRENLRLSERSETLQEQVSSQTGREQAVQDALVTAQELRSDMKQQAQREADVVIAQAQTEARRLLNEAEAEVRSMLRDAQRRLDQGSDALADMERRRGRFLKAFRQLLEREIDVVDVEEAREPLEDRPIDLDLGGGRTTAETPLAAMVAADDAPSEEPHGVGGDLGAAAVGLEEGAEAWAEEADAATTPPLDAPVDELTQAADAADGESQPWDPDFVGTAEAEREQDNLSLSLDDDQTEVEEDDRWG